MWALYDYIFKGELLGPSRTFKVEFANKITRVKLKSYFLIID